MDTLLCFLYGTALISGRLPEQLPDIRVEICSYQELIAPLSLGR